MINIAANHIVGFSIQIGSVSINKNSGNSVCAHRAINIILTQVTSIHSCISKNNIS
ncbi:hypothetical protein HOF65_02560 [bacterium]|nr:hypothetical protein [bacterium]MBT3852882.1 hypothetical protein [bacterium]MBT4633545.1 hypothetical protein [bacterium]MBT5492732.1 hypothetical protein [bacterium]MBT6778554.1 hypothetical protein [bacterium]